MNKIDGLEKKLIASNPKLQDNSTTPSIVSYPNPQEEMMDITEQITQLIANGVAPQEIAVLYKENKYGEEIAHFLQQKTFQYLLRGLLIY